MLSIPQLCWVVSCFHTFVLSVLFLGISSPSFPHGFAHSSPSRLWQILPLLWDLFILSHLKLQAAMVDLQCHQGKRICLSVPLFLCVPSPSLRSRMTCGVQTLYPCFREQKEREKGMPTNWISLKTLSSCCQNLICPMAILNKLHRDLENVAFITGGNEPN